MFLHLLARYPYFGICGIELLARGNAIVGPSYCYRIFFGCSSGLVWLISYVSTSKLSPQVTETHVCQIRRFALQLQEYILD